MERYKILTELGDGSCGNVYKARDMRTYEIVAVKKLKRRFYFWEEYTRLREIKALRKMNHPNIIKLKEVVRENNELFFIFEYMENNLYQVMKERQRPFSKEEIQRFMSQLFQGLSHMHRIGYFHRDLKPENLLVTNDLLKIADFGLAREVLSLPPYTQYVSTRWYRAPEVLLQSPYYTPAVDMWAAGAIMAELYIQSPIFPGESAIDQLCKICNILGPPDWATFPFEINASRLLNSIGYGEVLPANLSDIIPIASPEAIDLIKQLLSWNPSRRPSADASLQHPFFHVETLVPYPLRDPLELKLSSTASATPNLELKLHDFGPDPDECFLGLTLAVKPSASLDVVHGISQAMGEVFCTSINNQSDQPVFWSLISPLHEGNQAPVDSSLSLSFSSIQHAPTGVPESTGFSIQSLQPNFLSGPFLALSSPYQQGQYS